MANVEDALLNIVEVLLSFDIVWRGCLELGFNGESGKPAVLNGLKDGDGDMRNMMGCALK